MVWSLPMTHETKRRGATIAMSFKGHDRKTFIADTARDFAARRISKREFEKVYAVWDVYSTHKYPRSKLTNLSHNTTYIVSILHQAMQH